MNEQKKVELLEKAGGILDEEHKKALDLLEIDTGLDWHHTEFSFLKAVLDKDFIRELSLKVGDLPRRVNLYYNITLVLDPSNYNTALSVQYDEMQKNQLSLIDKDNDYLKEMERIQNEYKKDSKMLGQFKFEARLSELKNKQTETLNFIVNGEIVREFERLRTTNALHRMVLVLETI